MSVAAFVAVLAAGAAGGVARAWASWAVVRVVARPGAGTLAVNLIGAFLAGAVARAGAGSEIATVAAVGFLGAFTTFSTWMVELHARWRAGAHAAVAIEAAATLGAGVALAALGAWTMG
ncbi:MAG: CrcB family protein [Trueperaceae bacterium]